MPFQIPENLDQFSAAGLEDLRRIATEEWQTLRSSVDVHSVTADELDRLEELQQFRMETVPNELAERTDRESRFSAATEEEPEESEGDDESVTETTEEPAAVTASAKPRVADMKTNSPATDIPATEEPTRRAFSALVASASVSTGGGDTYEQGQRLTSMLDVAKVFEARSASHDAMGRRGMTTNGPVSMPVAQLVRDYPDEFSVNGDSTDYDKLLKVSDESRLPGGSLIASVALDRKRLEADHPERDSLVAAMGWCAPSETDYDICLQITTDGLADFPEVQARRGGIRHNTGIEFDTIFGAGTGYFDLTEAQVAAGTTKTCLEIPCPDFVDTRLGVTGLCLTGNILANRGYPEFTATFTRGALAASAHQINREQIADVEAHLAELNAQIDALQDELIEVAADITRRTAALEDREALLEDHLRTAYEKTQVSLLEVLLSADSLDEATTQVGYLMSVSDQDELLADEIRSIRAELETRRETLKDGRRALADARAVARDEEATLNARRDELTALEAQLADLRAAADAKRAAQESALNASLAAEGDVAQKIADNERAAQAAANLAAQLQQQASAQQAAIDEAKRRAAEEAARRASEQQQHQQQPAFSSRGFRWPERSFHITQEWGPTSFQLEPPYTYHGTWYAHFHAGIDFASGCGTPIYSIGPGVVVASGQPLMPWDTGFGVVVDHGGGVQSWYWHMQPRVVVGPGTVVTSESVIGYEGTTGMSTGCHVHHAINDHGVWENPRAYLP